MSKLKLAAIEDAKPVKLNLELPANVHRDLVTYAEALARQTGQTFSDPAKLIAPMLARSWQQIELLLRPVARVNFQSKGMGSDRRIEIGERQPAEGSDRKA